MRKLVLVAMVAVMGLSLVGTDVIGQEFDQYGLRRDRATATQPTQRPFDFNGSSSSTTQSPFRNLFSQDQTTERKPMRLFENVEMPKIQWPKFEMPTFNREGGPLFARPSWLPERDPNAPNFFQRMNMKSKELVDRATNWAQGKSAQLREKQTASWDQIRQTMERIKAGQADSMQAPRRTANGSRGTIFK